MDSWDKVLGYVVLHTLDSEAETKWPPFRISRCIFLSENVSILLRISLNSVPTVRIKNIAALDQIMACRRPGDKPLSEQIMVSLLRHSTFMS